MTRPSENRSAEYPVYLSTGSAARARQPGAQQHIEHYQRRAVAIACITKAAVSAVAFDAFAVRGFGVSDDDFARTVIAARFAITPRLDPSGTSWLPAPFWVNGAAMAIFGTSRAVALGVALVLGLASAGLFAIAAGWISRSAKGAITGAVLASAFAWSAILGVMTVPELPTAALVLLGIASIARPSPNTNDAQNEAILGAGTRRVLGAVALLGATLCRYEAWPVAIGVAAWNAWDGLRDPRARRSAWIAAAIAIAGPAAWIAWNAHAHGDAWRFLARVAAYQQALGGSAEQGISRAIAYPIALAIHAPEVVWPALAAGVLAVVHKPLRLRLKAFSRPVILVAAQMILLALAQMKDSGPTHHPERVTLTAMALCGLIFGAALTTRALGKAQRGALVAIGLIGLSAGLAAPTRRFDLVDRGPAVSAGALAAKRAPPGAIVAIDVLDYSYFAVIAGSGRPLGFVPEHRVDPRPAPPGDAEEAERAKKLGEAQYRVGPCAAASWEGAPEGEVIQGWCFGKIRR